MKKCYISLIMISMLLSLFILGGCGDDKVNTDVGDTIFEEDKTYDVFDGMDATFESFRGEEITFVNIWGTFCGPCIREMPDLKRLSEDYKNKGVRVVGIPIDIADQRGNILDAKYSEARNILNKSDISYINLVPDKSMFKSFLRDVQSVPTTIIVNKDGKQIGDTYYGAKSYEEWSQILDEILK